jgi:ribosomal protein S10
MKIHKRLIDLHSSADVVRQIVSVAGDYYYFLPKQSANIVVFAPQQTKISLEPGVEVEVTLAGPA